MHFSRLNQHWFLFTFGPVSLFLSVLVVQFTWAWIDPVSADLICLNRNIVTGENHGSDNKYKTYQGQQEQSAQDDRDRKKSLVL